MPGGMRRTRDGRTKDSVESRNIKPGIHIGRVVNHLDQRFMGALQVQLLKITEGGNDFQEGGQLITCQYAPPFAGQTPLQNVGANNTYAESQQSYGFWAVPPDVGTKVIVLLIEGMQDFGFWTGCVQDDYMNFMVPDGRAATANNNDGIKLPTGEYNKALVEPDGELQPTRYPKPVNTDFVESLSEQGLLEDDIRGLTSSSARREVPSAVFGINTPGPLDKRNGAPRNLRGATGQEASVPSSRLGGTSIVMDDGDDKILRTGSPETSPSEYVDIENSSGSGDNTRPANELFRVRTRTGHQILLHNTEDLIYIGNARGTSWIEMSSNGKIDIYAEDSISLHTSQDFNFSADRDINLNATENINIAAGNKIKTTAGASMDFTSVEYTSFVAGGSYTAKADSYISLSSDSTVGIAGVNSVAVTSSAADVNLSAAKFANVAGVSGIKMGSSGDAHMKIGGNIFQETNAYHVNSQEFFAYAKGQLNLKSDADMFLNSAVTMNIKGKSAYINSLSGDTHIKSGADVKINAVADISNYAVNVLRNATANIQDRAAAAIDVQSTGGYIRLNAATTMDVKSGTAMKITGNTMDLKTLGGVLIAEASSDLKLEGALVKIDAGDTASAATAGSASVASVAIGAQSATPATLAIRPNPVTPQTPIISLIAKIPSRVPQHEPWLQHENLNPLEYVPEKTRAGKESVDSFVQPIPDTFVNIGNRTTAGTTTASDRTSDRGYNPTDGDYEEETLGDFKNLARDTIYVVGDFHAVGIQSAGGFQGSPNASATAEQIAANQVGRVPENSVVIVAAGANSSDSSPDVVQKTVQEKIVDPLLRKNCYVLFVNYPTVDLAGSYASAYDAAGIDANYNAVRGALDQVGANGTIDLNQSEIDPADPRKLRATTAAYERIVQAAEAAVSALPDPSPFGEYNGTMGPLLAAIRICEVSDASPPGYSIVYGGITGSSRPPRPITQMSVQEVNNWQFSIRNNVTSTAAGAYQIISTTLKGLIDSGACSGSDRFDAATQDRLALSLLNRRGMSGWKEGQTSDEQFGYKMAQEWASMPVMITGVKLSSGTSTNVNNAYYGGVATNPSNARRPASFIKDALVRSKSGETQENEETEATLTGEELEALGFEGGDPYANLSTRSTFTTPGYVGGTGTERVRQRQIGQNKFRSLPVQQQLIDILNNAANATGCYVHISSGGQMSASDWQAYPASRRSGSVGGKCWVRERAGGPLVKARTGSRRHDSGMAADLQISRDPSPTTNNFVSYNFNNLPNLNGSNDRRSADNILWDKFISNAFYYGMRGFGFRYMGATTIHLDTLGAYIRAEGRYVNTVVGHWEATPAWCVQQAQNGLDAS